MSSEAICCVSVHIIMTAVWQVRHVHDNGEEKAGLQVQSCLHGEGLASKNWRASFVFRQFDYISRYMLLFKQTSLQQLYNPWSSAICLSI